MELEPAQGGGVHQGALGQGLSSYGEHPCADIGQSFQRNGGQRGPTAAAGDREVPGRKGNDLPHHAVFGEIGNAGDISFLVPEEGGGGQGQGTDQRQRQHRGEHPAESWGMIQRNDLLTLLMCPYFLC